VTADDLASQVEFWSKAGYDYIPLTVGMMQPGKVTQESKISKVIREVILADTADADKEESWNLELTSFIKTREDFDKFPWDVAAELDFDAFHSVKDLLPENMKMIAVSGKIFTLTWMLMGFNHFALSLIMDEDLVADVSNEMLRSAAPAEVEARVKELLENVAPGGGYCVGSGNSVPDWARFDNYMAMRDTALKFGGYPIQID
jgi:hypothetical protein